MPIHTQNLLEDFSENVSWSRGPKEGLISNIRSPSTAEKNSLVFVPDEKHLREALQGPAQTLVVHPRLLEQIPKSDGRTVLVTKNVQLVMAKAAKKYFPQTLAHTPVDGEFIHPSAVVAHSAKVGAGVRIGPGAVISDGCEIGESAIIGANSVLEPNVKIGPRTYIHPLVFIGHSCELGADCEVHPQTTIGTEGFGYAQDEKVEHHRITHYGRVVIEDRVHIGAGVQIDRGTFEDSRIGAGTKIDNHCHFGHNIKIGKNTLITGGMITAGSATIGSYCVFGGRTTVAGHISIADKTQFAGLSGISKTVEQPGAYGGYPLQDLKSHMKTTASFKSLPLLRKQMNRVLKKLGLEKEGESEL